VGDTTEECLEGTSILFYIAGAVPG